MLYIGGGGSEHDEARVWDLAFHAGQRISFWPYAQPVGIWDDVLAWFTGGLRPRGDFTITVGTEPDFGLTTADVVVVPGGNTFHLLAYMQQHGLVDRLKEFIARGGKLYGGSAGAILMGVDITIADSTLGGLDDNDIKLEDQHGLDLLRGCVIDPHYELEVHQEHSKKWAMERNVTVLGMPEKGGMMVDEKEGVFTNAGPADIYIFTPDGEMKTFEAGTEWTPGTRSSR